MNSPLTTTAVIPIFNGERTLAATLESILKQSKPPHELIVVFDGSTDGSTEVLDLFMATHTLTFPIRLIHQENMGQSAARNAAAALASGDLLAFLDHDDQWHPEHLAALTAPFSRNPELGWCYSDFDEVDGRGQLISRNFIRSNALAHPKGTIYQILGQDLMILPSASVISKRAFDAVGGFDPELMGYEDDDLFIRIFRAQWTTQFVPRSLTTFRTHANSSSAHSSFRRSRMIFFEKMMRELPDDIRAGRLYITDLLVPRLMSTTLNEYSIALSLGLNDDAKSIALTIGRLSSTGRLSMRRRIGLAVLSRPRLSRTLLLLHRSLPRIFRPHLSASLYLR